VCCRLKFDVLRFISFSSICRLAPVWRLLRIALLRFCTKPRASPAQPAVLGCCRHQHRFRFVFISLLSLTTTATARCFFIILLASAFHSPALCLSFHRWRHFVPSHPLPRLANMTRCCCYFALPFASHYPMCSYPLLIKMPPFPPVVAPPMSTFAFRSLLSPPRRHVPFSSRAIFAKNY